MTQIRLPVTAIIQLHFDFPIQIKEVLHLSTYNSAASLIIKYIYIPSSVPLIFLNYVDFIIPSSVSFLCISYAWSLIRFNAICATHISLLSFCTLYSYISFHELKTSLHTYVSSNENFLHFEIVINTRNT